MKHHTFFLYILSLSGALVAGCGGSQPPTGGPGATAADLAPRHEFRWRSVVCHQLRRDMGVYVTPGQARRVLRRPWCSWGCAPIDPGMSLCSEHTTGFTIYHHGAATPFTTLYDDYGAPRWCSVDPVSGNLAVMNEGNEIGIWTGAQGSPTFYTIGALADNASCAYDDSGDLFIVGLTQKTNATTLVEMPYGSNSFTTITLNHTPKGLPQDCSGRALP